MPTAATVFTAREQARTTAVIGRVVICRRWSKDGSFVLGAVVLNKR